MDLVEFTRQLEELRTQVEWLRRLESGGDFIPGANSNYLYGVTAASDSDFVSAIATLPGGASLTYGAVTSGAANTIVPWAALDANFNGKLVLHNTTRGTSALIASVTTGTSTIVLTANVPAGWQVGDTLTTRSQTNTATVAGVFRYFDLDFSGMSSIPDGSTVIVFHLGISDSGGGGAYAAFHPYETNSDSKSFQQWTSAATYRNNYPFFIPITEARRFCLGWNASGSATITVFLQHLGWIRG